MRPVSPRVIDRLLRSPIPRDQVLTSVRTLFNLLPGKSPSIDFDELPPEVELDLSDLTSARLSHLKGNFLKKAPFFKGGDPKQNAIQTFRKFEAHCRESNKRIRSLREGHFDDPLQTIISMAQRKISRVLRDFSLDELLSESRWGPGRTSSCSGPKVSSTAKFSARMDCTGAFLERARLLLPLLPSWSALASGADYGTLVNPMFHIVKGNRVALVPKTAKTHRAIAVEPHVNVYFQLGLGRMIRRRLKTRAAIDLDDQSLNRRLAKLGSIDGSLATIDLEGASDTVCTELVRELLPENWFEWLNAARSHYGELESETFRYQKFSSMGNGATFDLESLIFWAVSSAVVEKAGYNPFWVNVFGDDIIVPSGCYDEVVEALTGCGFIVNGRKSFSKGPFRESCGKDYFRGVDIRPVYLKRLPDRPIEWVIVANQIRILAHRWNNGLGCASELHSAWLFAISKVPKEIRYFVPYGYHLVRDDYGGFEGNGLLGNFDEAHLWVRSAQYQWDGIKTRAFSAKAVSSFESGRSRLTAGIFKTSQYGNDVPLRGMVSYREINLFIPGHWYDLGPWI